MMGFQIFFVVMFLMGIGAEANNFERCLETIKIDEEFDSIMNLASEERLNFFCGNMSSFLRCINRALKDETGLELQELVDILEGTVYGRAFRVLLNVQELIEDICTEGSELHDEYLANAQCYHDMPNHLVKDCEEQAKDAYSTFEELQEETGSSQNSVDEPCVVAAYQLGCLGADVKEHCGEEGFETYKKIVKKMGLFKSGLCSSEIMHTIKTDFLDRLEITEERKALHRVILDLKRRRR